MRFVFLALTIASSLTYTAAAQTLQERFSVIVRRGDGDDLGVRLLPRGRKEKQKQGARTQEAPKQTQKPENDASKPISLLTVQSRPPQPDRQDRKPQSGAGQSSRGGKGNAEGLEARVQPPNPQTPSTQGPVQPSPKSGASSSSSTMGRLSNPLGQDSLAISAEMAGFSFASSKRTSSLNKATALDKSAKKRLFSPVEHVAGRSFQPAETRVISGLVKHARSQTQQHDPPTSIDAELERTVNEVNRMKGESRDTMLAYNKYGQHELLEPLTNAKRKAKSARTKLDDAHEQAYQTFSQHEAGSRKSNQAFTAVFDKVKAESDTGTSYSKALLKASDKTSDIDPTKAKYRQTFWRQAYRSELRAASQDAFRTGYLASASKNIASSYDRKDSRRGPAFEDAVAMRKIYGTSVGHYSKVYEANQKIRNAMSGSDTEESEQDFQM